MERAEFDTFMRNIMLHTQTTPPKGLNGALITLSLWPKYQKLKKDRFTKMCKWVCENYEPYGNRFPTIAVFEKAKRSTATYVVDTFSEYKNIKYDGKVLRDAFNEVKSILPRPKSKPKTKSQKELIKEMIRVDKVYDVQNRVWVARKYIDRIAGKVYDPKQ